MSTKKTANLASYYSSDDVAKILGVNVATVKRWTDSKKLGCLKTAGGHRKFLARHISAFVKENKKYAQRLSVLPVDSRQELDLSSLILQADFDSLIPVALKEALDCNYDGLQALLNGIYLVHQDLSLLYDDVLTPVLHHIGELWSQGKLSVAQEHLASQAIRDCTVRLQEVVNHEAEQKEKVLVMTFRDELHDIPAKFAQHILQARGFQTLYSGQATPAGELDEVFKSFKPQRVYLSTTYFEDPLAAQSELDLLVKLCKVNGALLFVGGSGLSKLKLPAELSITQLDNYRDVAES